MQPQRRSAERPRRHRVPPIGQPRRRPLEQPLRVGHRQVDAAVRRGPAEPVVPERSVQPLAAGEEEDERHLLDEVALAVHAVVQRLEPHAEHAGAGAALGVAADAGRDEGRVDRLVAVVRHQHLLAQIDVHPPRSRGHLRRPRPRPGDAHRGARQHPAALDHHLARRDALDGEPRVLRHRRRGALERRRRRERRRPVRERERQGRPLDPGERARPIEPDLAQPHEPALAVAARPDAAGEQLVVGERDGVRRLEHRDDARVAARAAAHLGAPVAHAAPAQRRLARGRVPRIGVREHAAARRRGAVLEQRAPAVFAALDLDHRALVDDADPRSSAVGGHRPHRSGFDAHEVRAARSGEHRREAQRRRGARHHSVGVQRACLRRLPARAMQPGWAPCVP